jgi:hypothetical protein
VLAASAEQDDTRAAGAKRGWIDATLAKDREFVAWRTDHPDECVRGGLRHRTLMPNSVVRGMEPFSRQASTNGAKSVNRFIRRSTEKPSSLS